ncbi:MAG TPA: hypothetical protein IAA19_02880 [Candidatus Olsenella pullistercoris]|uniref:YcxB-like protein domain-containing protein n=1 Tax=Candidatus Olsenella pullistercoris TaxID=2838712 RepID=A0A9D2EY70_9ACTN|nr:hypothetical protein [Candidatus Olsenella pullistercoris]
MAKKSGKQVARRKDAARVAFDDKKYGHALFSATFEYSELTFARASEQLGLRLRSALTAASFASLVGLILVILIDESLVVLVGVLFVISLALVFTTSRWGDIQLRYARTTTLAAPATAERRHVVVCEDAVHVENEEGELGSYNLSDLRVVHATGEFVVAGFGHGRYAYVPRSALSENRFHELVRFLDGRCGR